MSQVPAAESLLIHAGTARDVGRPGTPPLVPASFYVSWGEPLPGRAYGRESNPGWEALEAALGGIEQADAAVFASGQAASMALLLALAKDRKRVVLCRDGYYGMRALASKLGAYGITPALVDHSPGRRPRPRPGRYAAASGRCCRSSSTPRRPRTRW